MSGKRGTKQTFDRMMERRRVEEYQANDLRKFHGANQRLAAAHQSDERVDSMRLVRRYQQRTAEEQTAATLEAEAKAAEEKRLIAEQDAALVAAMSQMKAREIADENNARRICDQSPELQELRARLKAVELNKTRLTQLAERDMLDQQRAAKDREDEAKIDELRRQAAEAEAEDNRVRQLLNIQRRDVLHEQIADKMRLKQEAYEQFLKEKAMVDEVVRSIEAEDAAKVAAVRQKQKELQENIRHYLEERTVWRQAEKKRAQEELVKIRQYNDMQQKRYEEMMVKKKAQMDMQNVVLVQLKKDMEAKQKEADDMERMLFELYQEEAEAKAANAIRAQQERERQSRVAMIQANEQQKAIKAQRQVEQRKEEEAFRAQMMAKFDADTKLEQLNAQKRRQARENYRKEVERLLDERRGMYEAAVQAEMDEKKKADDEESYRKRIVDEERKRLLQEHAQMLKDFVPKGVIRDASDFQTVFGRAPPASNQKAKPIRTGVTLAGL